VITEPLESSQAVRADGRYGKTAMAFHWTMFALVLIVGTLGLLHDDWPKQTQGFWINVHALLGLLLWFLLIARFWWRRCHPPPALPVGVGAFSRRCSGPVHIALYALLFVTPILGIVTFIYHGRIFDFGLFRLDVGIKKDPAVFEPTEDVHGYLAYALFALAGLHALAALWHRFYLRDGVLGRMWPSKPGAFPRADSASRRSGNPG
jgi:cytochrome b561